MRLFAAVLIPAEDRKLIAEKLLARIPKHGFRAVNEENLHITTCFVGEVEEEKARELEKRFLRMELPLRSGFMVSCGGVGTFGSNVLWLGVSEGALELARLAESISRELGVGFERFHAHVTLARNGGQGKREFEELAGRLGKEKFSIRFAVEKAVLMESKLSRLGASYAVVSERTFSSTASGV